MLEAPPTKPIRYIHTFPIDRIKTGLAVWFGEKKYQKLFIINGQSLGPATNSHVVLF